MTFRFAFGRPPAAAAEAMVATSRLEEGLWDRAGDLERLGYRVVRDADAFGFGGGQAIVVSGDSLLGGSDPRTDGHAAGF